MTCSQHAALTRWPRNACVVGGRIPNNVLDKNFFFKKATRRVCSEGGEQMTQSFSGSTKTLGSSAYSPWISQMSQSHLLADQSYVRTDNSRTPSKRHIPEPRGDFAQGQ